MSEIPVARQPSCCHTMLDHQFQNFHYSYRSQNLALTSKVTRKHPSRMRTTRWPTVGILVVATRCQYSRGGVLGIPVPWYMHPLHLDIHPLLVTPGSHHWKRIPQNRMTDTCENITFSPPRLAGGNEQHLPINLRQWS